MLERTKRASIEDAKEGEKLEKSRKVSVAAGEGRGERLGLKILPAPCKTPHCNHPAIRWCYRDQMISYFTRSLHVTLFKSCYQTFVQLRHKKSTILRC